MKKQPPEQQREPNYVTSANAFAIPRAAGITRTAFIPGKSNEHFDQAVDYNVNLQKMERSVKQQLDQCKPVVVEKETPKVADAAVLGGHITPVDHRPRTEIDPTGLPPVGSLQKLPRAGSVKKPVQGKQLPLIPAPQETGDFSEPGRIIPDKADDLKSKPLANKEKSNVEGADVPRGQETSADERLGKESIGHMPTSKSDQKIPRTRSAPKAAQVKQLPLIPVPVENGDFSEPDGVIPDIADDVKSPEPDLMQPKHLDTSHLLATTTVPKTFKNVAEDHKRARLDQFSSGLTYDQREHVLSGMCTCCRSNASYILLPQQTICCRILHWILKVIAALILLLSAVFICLLCQNVSRQTENAPVVFPETFVDAVINGYIRNMNDPPALGGNFAKALGSTYVSFARFFGWC